MKHKIAEQQEIILLNHLKKLYNSIRSTTWLTITHTEFMECEETKFILERIKIFEHELKKIKKINTKITRTIKKGLQEFKTNLPKTPVHLIINDFRQKIVIPTENQMVQSHSTPETKNWVKTCFVILRN